MRFSCPSCSKTLQMDDSLAGKKIKCPSCQAIVQTPARSGASQDTAKVSPATPRAPEKSRPVAGAPVVARPAAKSPASHTVASSQLSEGIDLGQLPLPPVNSSPSQFAWQPPRPKKNKSPGLSTSMIMLIAIGGGGLLVCTLFVGLGAVWLFNRTLDSPMAASPSSLATNPQMPQLAAPPGSPSSGAPSSNLSLPKFPELGSPQDLGGVNLYTVDLSTLNPTAQPGFATKFRIYLPAKQQAPGSLACVLVAPAGTTLLHGSDIDSGDYHDETLPYARAGMAVIHYSLDGPMADMQSFTSEQKLMQAMNNAYSQFRAADAGVTNGRIALEFALAKLPQVDPARIFCAGHSSAGTLALQLAVEESRIAKCAAYAPATNLELRLMELLAEPALVPVFPDLPSFLGRYSPYSNASRISCPVFLFHARDDTNEPWSTTNDYASQLKRLRKNTTFVSVDRGDHYQPMISSGIPKAIEWFQQPTVANQ